MSIKQLYKGMIRHVSEAWNFSSIIWIPCLAFYVAESFYHNPFKDIPFVLHIINCVLLCTITSFLWFLSGSRKWAIRIVMVLVCLLGLVDYYLISFRGIPLLPWDILFVGTAASVMGEFDFSIGMQTVVSIGATVFLFIIAGKFPETKETKLAIKKRMLLALVSAIAIVIQYQLFTVQEYRTMTQMSDELYAPYTLSHENGLLVTLALESHYMNLEEPEDYNSQKAENVLSSYKDDEINLVKQPNVLVIMSECFSDLSVLGTVQTSEDEMPFVRALQSGQKNTISGSMHVNVLAGNTANTEFEFLTGHTQAFLPDGSVTYQQYIDHDITSLVSHMNDMGYETVAFHPFLDTGWNRNHVYPYMQFDRFLDETDLQNPTRIRAYIDDKTATNKIIEQFEAAEKPLFLFTVTMQNHSPYDSIYDNFTPNITVDGSENFSLSNYLSLMQTSDEALRDLIMYLEGAEEETIVVFFGDHQPADSVVKDIWEPENGDYSKRYEVPFIVWANYDIETLSGVQTSANYLSAQVFDWCKIPKSAYQNYLLDLSKQYKIITTRGAITATGKKIDLNKINGFAGIDGSLLEYQKLQYYLMFD